MKNIVVFAAHPDDELLGVGGTIRRLANEGAHAHAVVLGEGLTSRKNHRDDALAVELERLKADAKKAAAVIGYESIDFCDLPDNRFDSIDLLDIIKCASRFVDVYQPETVFTHHHGDLNIDHRMTFQAVITACRPIVANPVRQIFTFETPSSTEWNFCYGSSQFAPNVFVDVTNTIDFKISGMACYSTESTEFPHPRSSEALKALAKYRGSTAGVSCAEAFQLIRMNL